MVLTTVIYLAQSVQQGAKQRKAPPKQQNIEK
jgi:hypothetical protein